LAASAFWTPIIPQSCAQISTTIILKYMSISFPIRVSAEKRFRKEKSIGEMDVGVKQPGDSSPGFWELKRKKIEEK